MQTTPSHLTPRNPQDTDNDGTGDNADTDDDGDNVLDADDAFPLDSSESVDTDNDGTGDNADTDDDGDNVLMQTTPSHLIQLNLKILFPTRIHRFQALQEYWQHLACLVQHLFVVMSERDRR